MSLMAKCMQASDLPASVSIIAFTSGFGLLQSQQELWRVLLGVSNQILKALHLRQPADAALLREAQVVINDVIFIIPLSATSAFLHACVAHISELSEK